MANYQTIDLPSVMLTQQANARVQFLIEQYYSSQFQSPSDLVQASASLYADFFQNIGQPLVTSLVFSGLPIAQDWNIYQRRAYGDMQILFGQTIYISSETDRARNFASIEDEMLVASTNTLQNQVSSFQATKSVGFGLQRWIAADDFYDHSKIDTSNTTALVTTGTVELARISNTEYSNALTLVVDDDYVNAIVSQDQSQEISSIFSAIAPTGLSNGFVGSTHEVLVNENTNTSAATASSVTGAVQLSANPSDSIAFVGDYGLHSDVNAVLDNNPNTWFEYELCNVPDSVKQTIAGGYGFSFTLGNADGSTVEIPWYIFHDASVSAGGSNSFTSKVELFPPIPSTSKPVLYGAQDISTDNGTLESGAPRVGGLLRLAINGALDSDKTMAQISILPNVFHGCVPVISAVMVKGTNDSEWTYATAIRSVADTQAFIDISSTLPSLSSNPASDTLRVWTFPPRPVKFIRIIIEQPQAYDTNIGHVVWAKQVTGINVLSSQPPDIYNALFAGQPQNTSSIASSNVSSTRTEGPTISLENLVRYQDTLQSSFGSSVQPTGVLGAVVGLISGVGSYLSGSTTATGDTGAPNSQKLSGPYIEYFPGWRYAIGIRDISLGIFSYSGNSILTSKDHIVPVDIKKISLQVHEEIPNSTDIPQYDNSTEWISYEFSLDGGAKWYPISPSSHYSSTKPKIYQVNPISGSSSVSSKQGVVLTAGYSASSSPVSKVRLRASIKRPDAVDSLSPFLHRYQLIIEGNSL